MTVVTTDAKARTMDFNANDVGYVPSMAGHSIENTGTEDLVFLEMFKSSRYADICWNQWIARMPDKMAEAHLKLPLSTIRSAPAFACRWVRYHLNGSWPELPDEFWPGVTFFRKARPNSFTNLEA